MQALKLCTGLPEPWDPPRSGRNQEVSEPLPPPGLKASEWASGGDRAEALPQAAQWQLLPLRLLRQPGRVLSGFWQLACRTATSPM